MPGRPRIAPEIHEKKGTYVAHPERRPAAGSFANGEIPQMPSDLVGLSRAESEWTRLVGEYENRGAIDSTSLDMIKQLAIAIHWQSELLKNLDPADKNLMVQYHKFTETIVKLLPQMGLTPATRSKIFTAPKQDESPGEAAAEAIRLARIG